MIYDRQQSRGMKINEAVKILRAHNEWRRAPAHLPEDAMPAMGEAVVEAVARARSMT